jgi:Family of unknown function (DUF6338)
VIPSTLLGLVVLAASIGPGYVWVRVAETRVPRGPRTQLLEVAELIIIGGLASTLSFLRVFSFAGVTTWIDTDALATQGTDYAIRHPGRALSVVLVGLVVAYLGAFAVARWGVYRKYPSIITLGRSAWQTMLGPRGANADRGVYATVDLREGTTIAGWVYQVTTDEVPPAERDLVLLATRWKPLKIRPPHADRFVDSQDRAIIVNGADVLAISASFYSLEEPRRPHQEFEEALAGLETDAAEEGEGESP